VLTKTLRRLHGWANSTSMPEIFRSSHARTSRSRAETKTFEMLPLLLRT
jgi:hypothetical protein